MKKKLSGTTIPELLVVMIVSGILFVLVFDGLSIVQRYGKILERKFTEKSTLLYSHQVLEALLEKTDSIRREENHLFLYKSNDIMVHRLDVDSTHILYEEAGFTDTLFTNLILVEFYPKSLTSSLIDSLSLFVRVGKDTIKLDYTIDMPYDTN